MPGATLDDLLDGVIRLLLDCTDDAGSPLFPQGTLSAEVGPGADTIPFQKTEGAPAIPGGCLLKYLDDVPERRIPIKRNTGSVLEVDTDRFGPGPTITGTHTEGTRIYCNLEKGDPVFLGRWLAGDAPCAYVFPRREVNESTSTGGPEGRPRTYQDHHAIFIWILMSMAKRDATSTDDALWALERQDRIRMIVRRVQDRIRIYPGLNGVADAWEPQLLENDWAPVPDGTFDVPVTGAALTYNPWVSRTSRTP